MRYISLLNPLFWIRQMYGLIASLPLFISMAKCDECERGERGEVPPWDDICFHHQERMRVAMPGIEKMWRERNDEC